MFESRSPSISIIIPVFNPGDYLQRCLESILTQRFTDFEILLIDDGSTDGSALVCDRFVEQDSRVRVLHKQNEGVSKARNIGLASARGEWITFIDADDVLLDDGLSILKGGISEDVDMVWGGYEVFDECGEKTYSVSARVSENLTNREGLEMLFRPKYFRYLGFVWGRLFRRAILCSSGISFDEDIVYNEDRLFCVRFMCSSNAGIRFMTIPVYGYIERQNSAMGMLKKCFQPTFITDLTATIRMRKVIYRNYPSDKSMREIIDSACFSSWRQIVGMKGYSNLDFETKAGVMMKLITGLGLWRFVQYDLSRNKNRIKKYIKRHL